MSDNYWEVAGKKTAAESNTRVKGGGGEEVKWEGEEVKGEGGGSEGWK